MTKLSNVDRLILFFAFTIPFVPPPSTPGLARIFAPAIIAALVVVLIWANGNSSRRRAGIMIPNWLGWVIGLMLLTSTWHAFRIIFNGERSEVLFFVSRALGCVFLVVFTSHLMRQRALVRPVLAGFFWGVVCLSLLIIFIGFTGLNILGDLRPPRTLGIKMPFHKTSGVLRSYGELGIMFSIGWAYLLAYRRKYPIWLQLGFFFVVLLAVLIAQSRNIYLAVVFMTVAHLMLPWLRLQTVKVAFILLAISMPVVVDTALPAIKDLALGKALIGSERFEMNVHSRGEQREIANEIIKAQLLRAVGGISHMDWLREMGDVAGYDPVMLHNHFYSLVVFTGLVPGLLTIIGLYFLPGVGLAGLTRNGGKECHVVFVAMLGGYSSLGFYEGWFSTTFLLLLSLIWVLASSRRPSAARGRTIPLRTERARPVSYGAS